MIRLKLNLIIRLIKRQTERISVCLFILYQKIKQHMKALFVAIQKRDKDKVVELLTKNPALVNAVAKQPPKRDNGQSPLQIAFNSYNIWAAKYFIEHNANLNYIEEETAGKWRMPVLHDAINAVMNLARFEYPLNPWDPEKEGLFGIKGKKEHFDQTFALLEMMINKGADVHALDSYGNSSLMRAFIVAEDRWTDKNRPLNKEAIEDFNKVVKLLLTNGADLNSSTPTRKPVSYMFSNLVKQLS